TVGVESVCGQGSTFWFDLSLPVARRHLSANSVAGPSGLNGTRVLVVDDLEVNRLILSEQIDSWGMIARTAASGAAALDLLREAAAAGEPFDLAIVDGRMPAMAGEALARHIKADPVIA